MNYQIKGNINYHLDIIASQLNESSNITINAFTSKNTKIPIGCKFQWFKICDTERIRIESQGNIYQCSIFDIGYRIEANVQSFESGQEGQAIVEFQKIQISSQLEIKLSQLYHNNMKQQIIANDQNWIFSLDCLENSTQQQKIMYSDQQLLPSQNQLQAHFMNQTLKFKSKEDKDSFCAFFVCMQALRRVHIKFIAYNIGKMNQKQVNFQQLLNSQLQQLINEKTQYGPKKLEIQQTNLQLPSSSDQRTTIQINQLRQEITQLQNEKQKQQQSIDKLSRENKELESNQRQQTSSKDQIESLDRLIQSLKNEVFSLKQRETDLMNQNARLTIVLNEKNERFENSLSQSQILDNYQIKQYQELLTESNQDKLKLQDELSKVQKQTHQQKSNLNIEFEREKLISTNQKLMQEIQSQTKTINELQIEIEMLKNMSRISMNMSQIQDPIVQTKLDQIEQENVYLQKKIEILEDELQKKKTQKPQKQQLDKDLQIQQLCDANKRYLNENIKLYEEIRSIRERLDISQIMNSSIKNSNVHENILSNQLEQQIEQMSSMHNLEMQQLKKKLEKATTDLQDAFVSKKQQEQLEKQNKRLAEENLYLQEQIKNLADLNTSKSFSVNMTNIICSDQYKQLEEQLNIQKRRFQEVQSRLDFQLQRDAQQQEKIKQFEVELLKYQSQVQKVDKLENKLLPDDLYKENKQIDQELTILIQEKEYHTSKIKQQDNQIFELKQKVMQLQEENRTLRLFPQSAETQMKQQIAQLQLQNQNLTEQMLKLQNQQNIFKDLSQSHISMNESIFESKIYEGKEYKLLENQKELLHLENQQLKKQINKDQLVQQENQELKHLLEKARAQFNDKIQSLQQELQSKIANNEKLSLEIDRLNNMKSGQDYVQSTYEDSLVKSLKLQILALQQENSKLMQDVANYRSTIQDKSMIDQINQSYSKRQNQDSDDSQQLINQLRIQLAEKTHQLKIVSTNYQQSNEDLQLIINKLGQENQNISEVHNSIKTRLETQISKLIEQLKDKDQQITQMSVGVSPYGSQSRITQQEDELQKKTNQIEQLIQQNKAQALQINTLYFELQELKLTTSSRFVSKEGNRETEQQIGNQKLEQEKQQQKIVINDLLSENSKFQGTIQKLHKELNESQVKLQQKIEDCQKILKAQQSTQIEIETLRKENQSLSLKVQEQKVQSNQEIDELKLKLHQLSSYSVIDEKQEQIKSNSILNQTIQQLQQKNIEIEMRCKQLLLESQDLTACIQEKDFQLKQQAQQNNCLSKELDNEQEKSQNFKKKIQELQQLIRNNESENQELQLKIKDLENALLIKDKTIFNQNTQLVEFEKLMSFDKSSDSYLITKSFHAQFNNSQDYTEKIYSDNQKTVLNGQKHQNHNDFQTKNKMDTIESKQQIELQNQKISTELQIQTTRVNALQQELQAFKGQNQKLNEQIVQQEEFIRLLKQNQQPQLNTSNYNGRMGQGQSQNEIIDLLKVENKQLKEYNQKLEKEVQEFENQKIISQQKMTISEFQLMQFEQEQLKMQNSKLLEIVKQQQQQIDRLSKSNLALMEENNRLNDQLKDVQNISYYSSDSQIH
ncbi:unnamed protein product (macronuclear) [Paramecium tetraurelia]|uniref:C2 NT-type domain-containing protein n=1 Tax=Paramecium tetraurelia TaxID=5888 RepID=A0C6A2_PARTE|nr:uncharacterized protein GSPATT00035448001 [Paramecium tetraurelia]CAK66319.1 unnamed protein product [Paramecium tetraurelia]|eukprot:XP_001433716.1 hypothetical protein (macronuclear) [Paramecium tetraurelia strain d4-2]